MPEVPLPPNSAAPVVPSPPDIVIPAPPGVIELPPPVSDNIEPPPPTMSRNDPDLSEIPFEPNEVVAACDDMRQTSIDSFIAKCMSSYNYFAVACLKIKPKTGPVCALEFNEAQQFLDDVVELMLSMYGQVRIIIVKGRQQGLSTWVEGRGYWKAIHNPGTKVYILAHESAASKGLFNMAKRYHTNCPSELKPIVKKSNAKELIFNELGSEYEVGTANSPETGRSQTPQFFHGSEVAYWKHAKEISGGLMEGIPEEPGTEVYLESTSAGPNGYFHNMWQGACFPGDEPAASWNGYWRVFIPWFWDSGYREKVPEGFEATAEELEIMQIFEIDEAQIMWRRKKIATKGGDLSQFQREYPATAAEAFSSTLVNALMDPMIVLKAQKAHREKLFQPMGRVIMGVDVAREGDDDTTIVLRQGRVITWYKRLSNYTGDRIAGVVMTIMQQTHIDHICIDGTGGYGASVYDFLVHYGLGHKVTLINFSSAALDEERYRNRRAEMYALMRDWLRDGASIPDEQEWLVEMCAITYKHDPSGERLQLERKDEIKKRIGKSTDLSDGAALTFCMPAVTLSSANDSFDPYQKFGVV